MPCWNAWQCASGRPGTTRSASRGDALEGGIGEVYLDGGYQAAQELVRRLFESVEINPTMAAIGKDPKTELQEWVQGRKMRLPQYRVVGTLGATHQQSFDVEVITQNIDDLHERAGSTRVMHLHGEVLKARSTRDPLLITPLNGPHLRLGDRCALDRN